MNEAYKPPTPTPEHEMIQTRAGRWNVHCSYYMDPSQPPMQVEATETVESLGPYWTASLFESEMPGPFQFQGRATFGYDSFRECFVGQWVDCTSPVPCSYEGGYDAETKTIAMSGRGFMPAMGGERDYRITIQITGADSHLFDMFVTMPDGNEIKLFTYQYERA